MQRFLIAMVATCCLVASLPAQSKKFYKWYDENQVAHYTATPPSGVETEVIRVQVPAGELPAQVKEPAPRATASAPSTTPPKNQSSKRQLDPETRKSNCNIARTDLEALETHPRIYIKDEKTGEKRFMTPDEHAARVQASRQAIKKYCK